MTSALMCWAEAFFLESDQEICKLFDLLVT